MATLFRRRWFDGAECSDQSAQPDRYAGGILVSQRLTNFRLEQLEREVREHNNFARRMPVVEEQIRVANHRIADLEQKAERKEGTM